MRFGVSWRRLRNWLAHLYIERLNNIIKIRFKFIADYTDPDDTSACDEDNKHSKEDFGLKKKNRWNVAINFTDGISCKELLNEYAIDYGFDPITLCYDRYLDVGRVCCETCKSNI
jgi:hypothetical protein